MSDAEKLGSHILERLRFYEELGVKWARKGVAQPSNPSRDRVQGRPAADSAQAPRPPSAVYRDTRTMFDSLPEKQETLEGIREDLGDCRRCKLAPFRKNIVFGCGNPHAELMFVGEAPGADEDDQGLPFVGRAGQLLTKIIEAIGMKREDVYICNILKCRPPENRNPEADEIATVKETQRRGWETNIKRNQYWLGQIVGREVAGEPVVDVLTFPERLARITASQIQQAAALMRKDNYVRMSLMPER